MGWTDGFVAAPLDAPSDQLIPYGIKGWVGRPVITGGPRADLNRGPVLGEDHPMSPSRPLGSTCRGRADPTWSPDPKNKFRGD